LKSFRQKPLPLADQRGFGLIELMAIVALIAIVAAVGLRGFDRRRQDINTSVRRVLADFRSTRARAVVSGGHFRFHRTGDTTYQIERLEEASGEWKVASVTHSIELPEHIALSTGDTDEIDLDSRGLVVFADDDAAAPRTLTLTDSKFSTSRTLTLYPSGQLHADF
jgi:type II secretory pathway pseudopilin PulG